MCNLSVVAVNGNMIPVGAHYWDHVWIMTPLINHQHIYRGQSALCCKHHAKHLHAQKTVAYILHLTSYMHMYKK